MPWSLPVRNACIAGSHSSCCKFCNNSFSENTTANLLLLFPTMLKPSRVLRLLGIWWDQPCISLEHSSLDSPFTAERGTRLLVIFHFSAISVVVRSSIYSLQEMHCSSKSVFLWRNIFNGLLPWLRLIWDANESVKKNRRCKYSFETLKPIQFPNKFKIMMIYHPNFCR